MYHLERILSVSSLFRCIEKGRNDRPFSLIEFRQS